jgi:hypothetical protein
MGAAWERHGMCELALSLCPCTQSVYGVQCKIEIEVELLRQATQQVLSFAVVTCGHRSAMKLCILYDDGHDGIRNSIKPTCH